MDENKISSDNMKNFRILYKEQIIKFKVFEELILKSFNDILNDENKNFLFIGMEKSFMFILTIITLAIKQYIDNIKNPKNNILDNLNKGDIVLYEGNAYVFDKVDINERYIYLDGGYLLVPYENSYLLTSYNRQEKYTYRIRRAWKQYRNSIITKKLISEITNMNFKKLNGIIKESTIIVFENRGKLFDLINSLQIVYDDESYSIAELFPFVYYTSGENCEYFKGDTIKGNPIIKFTSNIDTAVDIIRDDENVRNIVLIGEKTYKDSLETQLREAGMIDSIKKILVVDTWESSFDFSLFLKNDEPFNVYAITKEVVLDNINLYDKSLSCLESDLQKKNYDLLENMINKDIDIYEVENSEILNNNIYSINKSLKTLSECSDSNIKTSDFIKLAYYLCNKLEQSLLPLSECEDNLNSIVDRINMLKAILESFPEERVEYKLMSNIILEIEGTISFLEYKNNKMELIMQKLPNDNESLLIIKNMDELDEIEEYFKGYGKTNLNIDKIHLNIEVYGKSCLIVPYFHKDGYLNIINSNLISNKQIILYRRERNRMKSLIRKNNEMLSALLKNNKLSNDEDYELPIIIEHFLDKTDCIEEESHAVEQMIDKIEEEIEKDIKEKKNRSSIDVDRFSKVIFSNKTKVNRKVTFEDNNYSFLSDNYHANIVDRNNSDIKQKGVSDLHIGDEMIFAKSKLSGEQNIVKVVIKELLNVEEFENKYGEYFRLNNLWKKCLKNYMRIYDLTEKDISNKFRIYGKQITPSAIANWLNGNIIGPRVLSDIRIIADIVKDRHLYEKLEEVIVACKQERKIQVQIRKVLGKIIINSVVKNNEKDNEIYRIVKNTIGDLNKYAYIGVVSSIKDIQEEISSQYVNKVIERDE